MKKVGRKRRVLGWGLVAVAAAVALGVAVMPAGMGLVTYEGGTRRFRAMLCGRALTAAYVNLDFDQSAGSSTRRVMIVDYNVPPRWTSGWMGMEDLPLFVRMYNEHHSRMQEFSRIGRRPLVRVNLYWVAAGIGAVGGLLLWWGARARRPTERGGCLGCGYDLRGLVAGAVCPECGRGEGVRT